MHSPERKKGNLPASCAFNCLDEETFTLESKTELIKKTRRYTTKISDYPQFCPPSIENKSKLSCIIVGKVMHKTPQNTQTSINTSVLQIEAEIE